MSEEAVKEAPPAKKRVVIQRDGFTKDALVKSLRHPGVEVSIKYRPCRGLDQIAYDVSNARHSGDERKKALKAYLIKHLIAWDVLKEGPTEGSNPVAAPLDEASLDLMMEEDIILAIEREIGSAAWPAETMLGN